LEFCLPRGREGSKQPKVKIKKKGTTTAKPMLKRKAAGGKRNWYVIKSFDNVKGGGKRGRTSITLIREGEGVGRVLSLPSHTLSNEVERKKLDV